MTILLHLKNPDFSKKSSTYRLRDRIFSEILFRERLIDVLKFKISIMDKTSPDFVNIMNLYNDLVFPWELVEKNISIQDMTEEYRKLQLNKQKQQEDNNAK